MSKQPQKAYWLTHPYSRHSVERELERFMGWKTLLHLIRVAEDLPTNFEDSLVFADALAFGFATAGRISEWQHLRPNNFLETENYFEVREMEVHKRYKKVGHNVLCLRCSFLNEMFEVICKGCGANLVYGGKKKWLTSPVRLLRVPFKFPKSEATIPFVQRRLRMARENRWPFLFYNPHRKAPVSTKCFYDQFVEAGKRVGIEMWPHRERAERCKQLREEYNFTKDDLRRFTMIVADKTLEIYAGTSVTYEKKMGIA